MRLSSFLSLRSSAAEDVVDASLRVASSALGSEALPRGRPPGDRGAACYSALFLRLITFNLELTIE